jgi:hypothetical protein
VGLGEGVSVNVDVAVAVGVRVGVDVKVNVRVCVAVSTAAVTSGGFRCVTVGDKTTVAGGLVGVLVNVGTGKVTSNAVPTITRFIAVAASRIAPMIRRGVI